MASEEQGRRVMRLGGLWGLVMGPALAWFANANLGMEPWLAVSTASLVALQGFFFLGMSFLPSPNARSARGPGAIHGAKVAHRVQLLLLSGLCALGLAGVLLISLWWDVLGWDAEVISILTLSTGAAVVAFVLAARGYFVGV